MHHVEKALWRIYWLWKVDGRCPRREVARAAAVGVTALCAVEAVLLTGWVVLVLG